MIIKKYSLGFLFLFLSACSSDSESDKSNYLSSIQTLNKSFHQKRESSSAINQKIETITSANVNGNADVGVTTDVDVAENVGAIGVGVATDVGADTSVSIENLGNTSEGFQFATVQKVEINMDAGSSSGMGAEASPTAGTGADMNVVQNTEGKAIQELVDFDVDVAENVGAIGVGVATDVGADTSVSIESLGNTSEGFQFATVQKVEINMGAGSSMDAGSSSGMGTEASPTAGTGADMNVVQNTEGEAIQELVDFNVDVAENVGAIGVGVATDVGGHLIQKEECNGFSKSNWINQDFSIKQAIQDFTRKQIQNLLSINREFPSPQDKEDSVRCFVRTAFSLDNILRIVTGHWWEGVQEVSFQAPHEETLMKFIEHYFVAWIGYGLLLRIKPVFSDRIDFVVEEPYLLRDTQYVVVTNFTIMNFYSAQIIWVVNVQSFPESLSFLDISFEGMSPLYLLKNQMDYLFQRKNGNMDEVALKLQNKMDDSSFSNL